jgi:hypothetical protein
MIGRSVTLALTVVTATLGISAAAAAGTPRFDSKVSIHYSEATGTPTFYGKVRSERDRCKRHRHVTVFRKKEGPDIEMGSDRTGSRGRWKVKRASVPAHRTYYAKVRRRTTYAGVCKRARSKDLFIPAGP